MEEFRIAVFGAGGTGYTWEAKALVKITRIGV